MQTDHRVPTINTTAMRQQQYRKRSFSSLNSRKRDRHDLICVVCHAPAMGYNFDQITCESCKAFFRRNALNNAEKFKCRSGSDDCLITLETRKRCKACRLKKCFDKGLRKEWIMSEEEKLSKKQKIEDNRRLRAMSQSSTMFAFTPSSSPPTVPETEQYQYTIDFPKIYLDDYNNDSHEHQFDSFPDSQEFLFDIKPNHDILKYFDSFDDQCLLNLNERLLLAKIDENYTRAVRLNVVATKNLKSSSLRNLNDVTAVVNEPTQISTIRMITFFKLTPQFSSLLEDERLALVKCNLLAALYFHMSMCVNTETEIYQEPNMAGDFCYHASELRRYSDEIYNRSMRFIREVQDISSNDHLIIKLTMLVMIFTKGSQLSEPTYFQTNDVFRSQNIFLELLWKYFEARFDAEQTPLLYTRLIQAIIEAQAIARLTKQAIALKNLPNDQLAPLMQSVMLNSF